jgi:hypothetical protein
MSREDNPKWGNPRKRIECVCDVLYNRNKASRKKGLYKVYRTFDRVILICYTCQREQSYRILGAPEIKEGEKPKEEEDEIE